VAIALCVVGCSALLFNPEHPVDYSYEQYLNDFQKAHRLIGEDASSYTTHKALFEQRVAEILAHNADTTQSWKMGVNKFTDMTVEERRQYLGHSSSMSNSMRANYIEASVETGTLPNIALEDLPASVDWRQKGAVSPVKDQGGCGSCWAFAAVETIESAVFIATGKMPILSTQNMVSCTPNPQHCGGTGGCAGATSELGFQYVADKGIASEKDYPYKGVTGKCDESKPKTAKVHSFVKLPENNYTALIGALATIGPIAVSVDAQPWMAYSSGIFTGCGFNSIDIDHAVQAVGYGTENGKDYWIVRNSWGSFWGEKGYIRIFRHSDGASKWCGPDYSPADGTGCDGGPSQVTCCGSCGIWYDSSYPLGAQLV
jgi:cathepsin L